MRVILDGQEIVTAATVGVRRHVAALCRNLRPVDGAEDNDDPKAFDHHILGALAEFAVAKGLNLFWAPNVGAISKGDVGGLIEVRGRRRNGSGLDLVLKPADDDDRCYVLVHCDVPCFEIVGWIKGREGKGHPDAVWNDQRRIWFLPAQSLNDIENLQMGVQE